MTLDDINARLSFPVTPQLLHSLGVAPVSMSHTAHYAQDQFPEICQALIAFIDSLLEVA